MKKGENLKMKKYCLLYVFGALLGNPRTSFSNTDMKCSCDETRKNRCVKDVDKDQGVQDKAFVKNN